MRIRWIVGAVSCVVVDALLIIWLFDNYLVLNVAGPILIILWIFSLILGIVTGTAMKKFDLTPRDDPESPFIPQKIVNRIGMLLFWASSPLVVYIPPLLDLYGTNHMALFAVMFGILFATFTFYGLGMVIAYPNKKTHEKTVPTLETQPTSIE